MRPDLETYLWDRLPVAGTDGPMVRDTISHMVESGMIANAKQAWRTLEKWCGRGVYDYGVCIDLGWKYVADMAGAVEDAKRRRGP